MRIAIIGCPFQTSYGAYIESLSRAIERRAKAPVRWVGSNCGCGDPIERNRLFQTASCDYFEMRQIGDYPTNHRWQRSLRLLARNATYYFRAARYAGLSKGCDVVHFQQILNAFGSDVVFHWLRQESGAARVVTVHELDAEQTDFPERNKTYNRADAIIVHCDELKKKLTSLSVDSRRIHVVRYGTETAPEPPTTPRDGIVFYGGHKIMTGKGLRTMFDAMALLCQRLGDATPRLRIHGHYGTTTPAEAAAIAQAVGIENRIDWLNQISMAQIAQLYQSSQVLVLPYTGSFAGLPAGMAAAHGLPVVATPLAGIPEHIGDNGVWVRADDPVQVADRVEELLRDGAMRGDIATRLRQHAQDHLSWDVVADATLAVYRSAHERRMAARRSGFQIDNSKAA